MPIEEQTEQRTFSYREALEGFPRVRDRTHAAVRQIEALYNQVHSQSEHEARQQELHSSVEAIIEQWAVEIIALGCQIKGLWLVDWDSGDGYYCWKYPEESLSHFHTYDDGFAGRVQIA